mgnify:CR=1 FL=1
MYLYLFNDHTALTVSDHEPTITVDPPCAGVLEIEGIRFPIEAGGTPTPRLPELIGCVNVTFTDKRGVRYTVISPRMTGGYPYSAVDFVKEYVGLRVGVDRLERQFENLSAGLRAMQAEFRPNALGFLTHNNKNTEEKKS